GPGNTLARLTAAILAERPHVAVSFDQRQQEGGYVSACQAIARLAAAGGPLDFGALWAGEAGPGHPLGRPRPKRGLPIDGSNYGKPPAPEPRPTRAPVTPAAPVGVGGLAPLIAAQMEFHRLMTESHTTFLRAVEASSRGLGSAADVASMV